MLIGKTDLQREKEKSFPPIGSLLKWPPRPRSDAINSFVSPMWMRSPKALDHLQLLFKVIRKLDGNWSSWDVNRHPWNAGAGLVSWAVLLAYGSYIHTRDPHSLHGACFAKSSLETMNCTCWSSVPWFHPCVTSNFSGDAFLSYHLDTFILPIFPQKKKAGYWSLFDKLYKPYNFRN